MNIARIISLLRKEFVLESRQAHAFWSVILFAACTVFLVFKSFNNLRAFEWNVLMWIIVIFSGINAVAKSFAQEEQATMRYYYTLYHPAELLVAKWIYNTLFLIGILIAVSLLLIMFTINPIKDLGLFSLGAVLGATALSSIFTFIAAMTGIDRSGSTMMSVMALPLVLPVVLLLLKITAVSMRLMQDSSVMTDVALLGALSLMLFGLKLLLFPFIWRS